jgi:hypothetical protein
MRRNIRPYVKIEHGVLVDREVLDHLLDHALRVIFDKMRCPYPLIVDAEGRTRDLLHRFTCGFVHGFDKVNDERYVVHHRRPNKKNCRAENLVAVLRADHARLHRHLDDKKREDLDVFGLWRPHERRPEKVVDPDAPLPERADGKSAREAYAPPSEWDGPGAGTSLAAQLREAELVLDIAFDALDLVTRPLDSRIAIPKARSAGSSRDRASRAAGVAPIRLGCWRSEAALVRVLARHERPDGSFDLVAAGAEVDIHPTLFSHFLKRPAVAVALDRWRGYRRLPKPSPLGWPYRRSS